MFHIVLFEPEIPPNTGNIIRLCANSGSRLHLIQPLGFSLEEKKLRRAGLDYHEFSSISLYENFEQWCSAHPNTRIFALSTKGQDSYHQVAFEEGDALLLGPETRGLPQDIRTHQRVTNVIRLPMQPDSRSLNLSNATAIILYEALRQLNFKGLQ